MKILYIPCKSEPDAIELQSILVYILKHWLTVLRNCQVSCFLGTKRSLQNLMKS